METGIRKYVFSGDFINNYRSNYCSYSHLYILAAIDATTFNAQIQDDAKRLSRRFEKHFQNEKERSFHRLHNRDMDVLLANQLSRNEGIFCNFDFGRRRRAVIDDARFSGLGCSCTGRFWSFPHSDRMGFDDVWRRFRPRSDFRNFVARNTIAGDDVFRTDCTVFRVFGEKELIILSKLTTISMHPNHDVPLVLDVKIAMTIGRGHYMRLLILQIL